jgi:hypothetical protein
MLVMFNVTVPMERKHAITKVDRRVELIDLKGLLGSDEDYGVWSYFGRDGEVLVILLTGGTKKRQQRDVDTAKALWTDYKRRRSRTR